MSANFHKLAAWAKRELPDEYVPFAASAALSLTALGQEVTPEMVRERLVDQGRDHKANAERAVKEQAA